MECGAGQVAGAWGPDSSGYLRQLAQLVPLADTAAPQTLAERLGGWLAWTDAIALAGALNGTTATAPDARSALSDPRAATPEACRQVHQRLLQAIDSDAQLRTPGNACGVNPDPGFGPWRQRLLTHQRSMASRIGALRADLRAALMLPAAGANGARLAALDAAMEQITHAHEHQLLARAIERLARQFEAAPATRPPTPDPAAWRADAGRRLQALLRAELALRWQPIEGLLAALASLTVPAEPAASPT